MPVVSIKSQVVQVNKCVCGDIVGYNKRCVVTKPTKVAVIPVGYADGFLSSYIGLKIWVKGKLCEVLNVCMDCFMLDVSNLNIKKGDFVFLINKQNPLSKYSRYSNLSEYEVMCNFHNIRACKKLIFSHRHNKQHNS